MSYEWIDLIAYLLYGIKWLAIVLACVLLVLGIDDLLVDVTYWCRRLWRSFSIYRRNPKADEERLFAAAEKPLAIMVPAWRETGVVGPMAELAANSLDYENYQIFVGTYPNDPETQAEVDQVCLRFPHVHKVVCARPGPTSKADCLNNVVDAILRFEKEAGVEFAGFILHDAEDVISPLELRLFNYLLPRKDLIQVPVYPFPPRWYEFTAGHYVDEFSEQHSKDIVVREALLGQVPSAGVGTCFSRRAMAALLEDSEGVAFDTQSLTEDYEIGMRLAQKGMKGIFARYSVKDPRYATSREHGFGASDRGGNVICVREHFPRSFMQAVRQKSRWIVGIVFQGTRSMGWSKNPVMNYFLWRDRRGAIANAVGLLVNLVLLTVILLWLISLIWVDAWHFMSLLGGNRLLNTLLIINGFLLLNRLLQRFYFVSLYYGFVQGLLSAPRMLWSNLINFFANFRAIRQVIRQGDSRRVAWDKTSHEFPSVNQARPVPVGRRLVELGVISEEELAEALLNAQGRRLGRVLMVRGAVTSGQMAQVVAEQAGLPWRHLNPFVLDEALIAAFPAKLALRYCTLPVERHGRTLVLASEKPLTRISLGAISRQVKRPVENCIAPRGRVTVGLRYWYGSTQGRDYRPLLEKLRARANDEQFFEQFCRHQVLLGDLLQEMGMLPPSLFAQAMFDFDPQKQSLGEYLVERGLISEEVLQQALDEQRQQQAEARQLLEAAP